MESGCHEPGGCHEIGMPVSIEIDDDRIEAPFRPGPERESLHVVGERRQTDFKSEASGHIVTESYEIKVRNHKDATVDVIVEETMYRWSNWEMTKTNIEPKKLDSRVVHFPLTIAKDGEGVVRYTVRYSW